MELLKNHRKFSFIYDGKTLEECKYSIRQTEQDQVLTTVYTFSDGLVVTNIARKYEKYGAYEWVNYFENTGNVPTGIVSCLYDCDITLPFAHQVSRRGTVNLPDADEVTKIIWPTGSDWSKDEFSSNVDEMRESRRPQYLPVDGVRKYSSKGGRSSNGKAPFFNVHKAGTGVIGAIGWSGQWNCELSRKEDTLTIRSKIEDTHFRLLPGERLRTSSIVLMPYACDLTTAQNRWRRLLKEHFSLVGQPGRGEYAPLSASIWGGMTTKSVLERVEFIRKNQLPYEYIWIDAGWYGIDNLPSPDHVEGDWSEKTGDWRVSRLIHPEGMKDIAAAVHDAGMKFLLWAEPERARANVPMVREHPDWFLSTGNPRDDNRLLNLGDERAYRYCFDAMAELIEELELDCLRQDFNMDPLACWRSLDEEDRQGITEIKYVNNLYRLWDELLTKYPNLIIDNCSSGGRRIDIELLRRSVPLWRSDYQCHFNCDIEGSQNHNISFNTWLPCTGTGCGNLYDEYRVRSSYAAAMMTYHTYLERDDYYSGNKAAFIGKYMREYLSVRPYFYEDFYPLTKITNNTDAWSAAQFDRPAMGDGIVQVFRREDSPFETAVFTLGGISADKTYRFTDLDDGRSVSIRGEELCADGFRVTIKERRKAKIYRYQAEEN
ncbi:MAG: hypothetical protein E7463_12175 [Ruminococcaceae bacterium]|nr:hypothetical protein [Oscillospiraceae bacterium]